MGTVLIVDDDPVTRVVVKAVLKGFKIESADNVTNAMQILQNSQKKIDLILCDVVLADESGYKLLDLVHSDPNLRDIPVIMISAEFSTFGPTKECADFLTKPIAKDLLIKKVGVVLNASKLRLKEKEYEEHLSELQLQLSEMNSKTMELLDTPLQAIIRRVSALTAESGGVDDEKTLSIRTELKAVLQDLARTNLYSSSFDRILETGNLDPISRSLLLETFQQQPKRILSPPTLEISNRFLMKATTLQLSSWELNQFDMNEEELVSATISMWENLGLVDTLHIDVQKLRSYIESVKNYQHSGVSYHSFRHLFDCSQACFSFLVSAKEHLQIQIIDAFVLMFSALIHDVDHPGCTNSFLINTSNDLALIYNDNSVLENHHASTGFKLLRNSQLNIFSSFSRAQQQMIRSRTVELILGTDMQRHTLFITKWEALHLAKTQHANADESEFRQAFLQLLLKCADISNVARPWKIAHEWGHRVCNEFYNQGEKEKRLGLNVAPYMDRKLSTVPQVQLAFIDYQASGLFSFLLDSIPGVKGLLEHLMANRNHWNEITLFAFFFNNQVYHLSPKLKPIEEMNNVLSKLRNKIKEQ